MKERERGRIFLFRESHFAKRVCSRPGEPTLVVIIQHSLKINPRARGFVEIAIAFAQGEICIRAARCSRVIIQIFLVFRDGKVIKFASKESIGVFELTAIGWHRFDRRRCCFFDRQGARWRGFVHRLGTTHVRPLAESRREKRKKHYRF